MQFRVIVVSDPQTHHTHTHQQTGPITIHCAAAWLARSVVNGWALVDWRNYLLLWQMRRQTETAVKLAIFSASL